MTPNDLCDRLKRVAVLWRVGELVWHKASGKRGIVLGYVIDGQGSVCFRVVFADSCDDCYPEELSKTQIKLDDDRENWQDLQDNDDDL